MPVYKVTLVFVPGPLLRHAPTPVFQPGWYCIVTRDGEAVFLTVLCSLQKDAVREAENWIKLVSTKDQSST